MKNGTLYAKKVKRLFRELKQTHGAPEIPEPSDPLQQLLLALLSVENTEVKASRAIKALYESMVDLNEIRVSTDGEIAGAIRKHVPSPARHAAAIRKALNAIFRKEHAIRLDQLRKLGRRDARQYLESIDGVDAASAASVVLWSLGGHAIPVDERLCEALRRADLVDDSANVAQVQAFLERNIAAHEAKEFCLLMQRFVASKVRIPTGSNHAKKKKSAKTTIQSQTRRATKSKPASTGVKRSSTKKKKRARLRKR